jgi:hypothetical protein
MDVFVQPFPVTGGIDVVDVQGDLVVKRGGSGHVRHSGVARRVDVPSD